MKSTDVAMYGVTAQPQEEADKAVVQLGLHYKAFGDPDHNLAKHLKEKGLLDVIITRRADSMHPKVKDYKDGLAQPGMCVSCTLCTELLVCGSSVSYKVS